MLLNTLVLLLAGVSAHPGESHEVSNEVQLARRSFVDHVKRQSSTCNSLSRRSNEQLAEKHRNKIAQLRREVQAKKQKRDDSSSDDADRYASIDHESSRTDISVDMSLSDLFTSDEATCLLQPEVTNGPYYVTGEYIREDITEDQEGVPLYISVDFFDTSSCEAVPNLYWEVWHCNALGIYSGVQASTNGDNVDNTNSTWLRGIVETDEDGAATMQTIFPGHYTGRATHIHVMAHKDVTVFDNGTIGSGTAASGNILHVGQLFFDQDLLTEVESTSPYSSNEQGVTENTSDTILISEEGADAPDPFFKYVKLGDDVSDGIYAWISIGLDSTASYTANPAAYYDAEGGHSTGDDSGPGGNSGGDMGGMGGGNGTDSTGPGGSGMPSGASDMMPSGTASGDMSGFNTTVSCASSASAKTASSSSSSHSNSTCSVCEATASTVETVSSSGAGIMQIPSIFRAFIALYL